MPRGRKPKPAEMKRAEGDGVHDTRGRVIPDDTPTANGKRPRRPDHLSDTAAKAWDELCDELEGMGVLSTSDAAALTTLAEQIGIMRDAYAQLKQDGKGGRVATVILLPNKMPAPHPAIAILNNAAKIAKPLYAEFGITPSARSRVKVNKPDEEPDPFAGLDEGDG